MLSMVFIRADKGRIESVVARMMSAKAPGFSGASRVFVLQMIRLAIRFYSPEVLAAAAPCVTA